MDILPNLHISSSEAIYYYTDMTALISKLRVDNIVLRAIHHRFLNDPKKFEIGKNIISQRYNVDIPKSFHANCFLTSFILSSSYPSIYAQCFYGKTAFEDWLSKIIDSSMKNEFENEV